MPATILVVDDNTYIVDGLVAILKKKGYTCQTACNGEEALEKLRSLTPDLILLDISMELMNGWETLEKIREDPPLSQIPVIVFSARKRLEEETKDQALAVDAVIAKPINTRLLLSAIEDSLERKQEKHKNNKVGDNIVIKLGFDNHIHDN